MKKKPNKFDEYKIFIDDTARFTERRQSVSNLYVTVNSILLTALMFAVKDMGTDEMWKMSFPALIIVAGGFVSFVWHQLIRKYKALVGFRINKLRDIENHPDVAWTERMYHAEDVLYPRDAEGNMVKGRVLISLIGKPAYPLSLLPSIFLRAFLLL